MPCCNPRHSAAGPDLQCADAVEIGDAVEIVSDPAIKLLRSESKGNPIGGVRLPAGLVERRFPSGTAFGAGVLACAGLRFATVDSNVAFAMVNAGIRSGVVSVVILLARIVCSGGDRSRKVRRLVFDAAALAGRSGGTRSHAMSGARSGAPRFRHAAAPAQDAPCVVELHDPTSSHLRVEEAQALPYVGARWLP